MPPSLLTTLANAFRYPTDTNNGTDFATGVADLASDVDGMWGSGTLVSRPSSPRPGSVYRATDAGTAAMSDGSTWHTIFAPGDLKFSAAVNPPTGWLVCDGSAVSRSTYALLFAAIGVTYGTGDGSSTFNVPDYRGRTIVGAGSGAGLTTRARGATGGEETHALSTGEMPSHSHTLGQGFIEYAAGGGGTNFTPGAALPLQGPVANTDSTGGGASHNNMQPFGTANVFIKI